MKLVTSAQMREIDRESIEKLGIPGPVLMENAGRGIAERILSTIITPDEKTRVAVFCGKGNNGGDGFVVARYLKEAGVETFVYYLGPPEKLSPDAKLNFDRATGSNISLTEILSRQDLPEQLEADWIVDALFGTGFEGTPRDLSKEIIEYINCQSLPVIAVDMPSGLNADTGGHEGEVVRADHTLTLAQPKYGLFVSPGRELSGSVRVVPIGIPEEVVNRLAPDVDLLTPEFVRENLPVRKPDGHKGDFGKLFLLAGSTGLTGAAALAAKSALRSGCGLVKVGCPRSVQPIVATCVIEATSVPLPDVAKKGALALRGLGEIRQHLRDHDAVVIGPGLGTNHETAELVRRLLSKLEKPAIVDADGLNALAGHLDILKRIKSPIILTPHPGEFARLTGDKTAADIHGRIAAAKSFASENDVVLVLKGSPTVVAGPDGKCAVNPTGNNGMAAGGSGDVLSGIIGTLLAQGLGAFEAASVGVYIHGLAGDIAADDLSARSMIAGDMLDTLGDAFMAME